MSPCERVWCVSMLSGQVNAYRGQRKTLCVLLDSIFLWYRIPELDTQPVKPIGPPTSALNSWGFRHIGPTKSNFFMQWGFEPQSSCFCHEPSSQPLPLTFHSLWFPCLIKLLGKQFLLGFACLFLCWQLWKHFSWYWQRTAEYFTLCV